MSDFYHMSANAIVAIAFVAYLMMAVAAPLAGLPECTSQDEEEVGTDE